MISSAIIPNIVRLTIMAIHQAGKFMLPKNVIISAPVAKPAPITEPKKSRVISNTCIINLRPYCLRKVLRR